VVGPPGFGKTKMLSALKGSRRCVFRSNVTPGGLVSGWRGDGARDPSLIPKLKNKTLVAKDFTEVLAMPQAAQDEVFSTLRGAYDGEVDKSFGNGVHRRYEDCYFAVLAGVTHAIGGLQNSSLGERFLKYRLPDPSLEQRRAIKEKIGDLLGRRDDADRELREVVARFLKRRIADVGELPPVRPDVKEGLYALVDLVAVIRAHVARDPRSGDVAYRPEPEAPTRLLSQLLQLARIIAWIDGDDEAGDEAYAAVRRIAMDTARSFQLDVVDAIMRMGGSAVRRDVAVAGRIPSTTLQRRFEDLTMLGVLEQAEEKSKSGPSGGRPAITYRVSARIAELWRKSQGVEDASSVEAGGAGPRVHGQVRVRRRREARKSEAGAGAAVRGEGQPGPGGRGGRDPVPGECRRRHVRRRRP
jgi:hypothetical protein